MWRLNDFVWLWLLFWYFPVVSWKNNAIKTYFWSRSQRNSDESSGTTLYMSFTPNFLLYPSLNKGFSHLKGREMKFRNESKIAWGFIKYWWKYEAFSLKYYNRNNRLMLLISLTNLVSFTVMIKIKILGSESLTWWLVGVHLSLHIILVRERSGGGEGKGLIGV